MTVLFLVFKETSILFSIVVALNYISMNSVQDSPFAAPLSAVVICRLFDDSHSERCDITVVLICVSLVISDVDHLFMGMLATCTSSMEKCPFRSSVHFFIGLFL